MDFHSIRRQKGRTLLVGLTCTSLLLFAFNHADLATSFRPNAGDSLPSLHPTSHMHDYRRPEYTAARNASNSSRSYLPEQPYHDSKEVAGHREERHREDVENKDKELEEAEYKEVVHKDETEHREKGQRKEATASEEEVGEDPKEETSLTGKAEPQKEADIEEKTNPDTSDEETDPDEGQEEEADTVKATPAKRIVYPATMKGSIEAILASQRQTIGKAMVNYKFHPELKAKSMDDLIIEKGGNPVRSLVITTWRSGSTFIGDVLQSHPATYYHYEPLLDFGITQVRHGKHAEQAIHNLRHLLNCDYSDMKHYLDYGPSHQWLFSHNQQLWHYCTSFPKLCWKPEFLTPFCKLFPFQSLKTVRLRLNLTKEFLEDKTLGVQVLLLVRDPRGTLQSRQHRNWCPGKPDCDDPVRLCDDLVSDYNTAHNFKRRFPHSFRVVRYEDLSFHAYNMTKELFDFFHLSYHSRVQNFLDTHTTKKIGGVSSTFRDSKTAPIHWQRDLSWNEVERIQKVCLKALKVWGYEIAKDENHLRSFMPVGKFKND